MQRHNHGLATRRDDRYGGEVILYAEFALPKDHVWDVYGQLCEPDEHEDAWFYDDEYDFMPIAPFIHILNNGGRTEPEWRPNCDLVDTEHGYQVVTLRDIEAGEPLIAYVYQLEEAWSDTREAA